MNAKTVTKLWTAIAVLVLFSPLGLIVAGHFKAGPAWGEWGAVEIREFVGYIPRGLDKISNIWNAPIPAYAFMEWGRKDILGTGLSYIVSAAVGVIIIVVVTLMLGRILAKRQED